MRNSVFRLLLCVTSILLAPFAASLPAGAAQIYWTNANADKIQRAELDGSNVTTLVTNVTAAGLAVDAAGGHL